MIKVQGLRRNVKNVVKNYTDVQIKVRKATSNDPWGPSGTLMSEIADLSYNVVAFSEIMQVIWKRLNDHGKNWKHVYKALILMEYLLKCGSDRIIQQCKENIFVIETLKDFRYIEENKDQGISIREKAKLIVSLLKDDERLKNERARALKARERFSHSSSAERMEYEKQYSPEEYADRQSSFDQATLSPRDVLRSELERVRPQTIGEEELQLQLALAVSKEEADQAERLKRNDELRLQMALSESREVYEKDKNQPPNASSAMEDLIDVFTKQEDSDHGTLSNIDPWGMPVSQSQNSLASSASGDLALMMPDKGFNSFMSNSASCYDFSGMKHSLSDSSEVANLSAEKVTIPSEFLGENSNLVNLDSLVEGRSHGNPFQPPKPSQPSINELRAQSNSFSAATLPSKSALPHSSHLPTRNDSASNKEFLQLSNNPFI